MNSRPNVHDAVAKGRDASLVTAGSSLGLARPVRAAEHASEAIMQRRAEVCRWVNIKNGGGVRLTQSGHLLVGQPALDVSGRDLLDLIAIDKSEPGIGRHDNAVKEILRRNLEDVLDAAELSPGCR